LAAGDELLDAVEHITVAVAPRARAQLRGVGAGLRLGQGKAAQQLAARQRRQPALLLRAAAVAQQDGVDRAVGDADGGAHAAVAGRDFFQHQRQRQGVEPHTAQRLGHADAVATQGRQPLVGLFGEDVPLVPSSGVGPQLLEGEGAHGVADLQLVGGEQHG